MLTQLAPLLRGFCVIFFFMKGLERMASELVTGMLRVVERCDQEEGEIRLVTELFPPFTDLFKQIWAADKAFALQCMQHYTSWLKGPPNRPTEDEVRHVFFSCAVRWWRDCRGLRSLVPSSVPCLRLLAWG